jgi:hypothetical protein
VRQCSVCQHAKHNNTHPYGLLQPLPIPAGAWQDITMEFVEGLTTGIAFFAECLRHSAKAILHSAKPLPSVTLGKYFIGKGFFAE